METMRYVVNNYSLFLSRLIFCQVVSAKLTVDPVQRSCYYKPNMWHLGNCRDIIIIIIIIMVHNQIYSGAGPSTD